MTGTLNGAAVDTQVTLTPDVLRYQLNNGANPLFINLIRRVRLSGRTRAHGLRRPSWRKRAAGSPSPIPRTPCSTSRTTRASSSSRAGTWTPRPPSACTSGRRLYFEFEEKLVYARYYGVKVDQGKAQHSVKASEFNFNFGWAFR